VILVCMCMYLVCGARGVHECFGACRCFVISIAVWHVSVVTREAEHFSSKGRPTKAAATRQAGWELVATAWTCLRATRVGERLSEPARGARGLWHGQMAP
jgi:hypothetical protein